MIFALNHMLDTVLFIFVSNFLINFHFEFVCGLDIMQNVFLFNLGANEHININGSGILGVRGGGGVADDNEVQEVDPLFVFISFELIIIGIHLLFRFLFSATFECI